MSGVEDDIGNTDRRTTAEICRPVLRMHGHNKYLPLTQSYSNTSGFGATVDTINDWLEQA